MIFLLTGLFLNHHCKIDGQLIYCPQCSQHIRRWFNLIKHYSRLRLSYMIHAILPQANKPPTWELYN